MISRFGFMLCVLILLATVHVYANDSLRIEREGDRLYVIHQVEQGETLYGLSRRYKSSMDEIKNSNGGLSGGLTIGTVIKIPLANAKQVNVAVSPAQPKPVNPTQFDGHEVKPGETLYSIARRYSISVDQVKEWNNLKSNEISTGQLLQVKPGNAEQKPSKLPPDSLKTKKTETKPVETVAPSKEPPADTKTPLKTDTTSLDQTTANVKEKESKPEPTGITVIKGTGKAPVDMSLLVDPNQETDPSSSYSPVTKENMSQKRKTDFKKIQEEGMAEAIAEGPDHQRYLALHRTAPVGTIIQVENEMNGHMVFVRVIGKLPDTGANTKLIIKLSQKACSSLGMVDKRFPVKLSYIP
jgi:LysM repeat protein